MKRFNINDWSEELLIDSSDMEESEHQEFIYNLVMDWVDEKTQELFFHDGATDYTKNFLELYSSVFTDEFIEKL